MNNWFVFKCVKEGLLGLSIEPVRVRVDFVVMFTLVDLILLGFVLVYWLRVYLVGLD